MIVGVVVFIVGLTGFFFSWAAADAIRPMPLARVAFKIISFPVFTVSPTHFAVTFFWQLAFLNYLGWGALATCLTRLWKSD